MRVLAVAIAVRTPKNPAAHRNFETFVSTLLP